MARTTRGRMERTITTAERDAEAARLRAQSLSYRQIGERLGMDVGGAHRAVQRALRAVVAEPAEDVRALELEKLDAMERILLEILGRQHVIVSNGRVVMLDGSPIPDTGPILATVDRLVKVAERRARLSGLDSPAKLTVDGGVRYVLEGVNPAELT